jgi:hypothetical protein
MQKDLQRLAIYLALQQLTVLKMVLEIKSAYVSPGFREL